MQSVIIHERLANWARQLRPRLQGWPIRWSETRTTSSLLEVVARSNVPILVIELDERPARGLKDLQAALEVNSSTLSLVIDPIGHDNLVELGRELGATLVLSGVVVPPEVESLLHRWLPLARHRAESGGWWPTLEPEPEPWERPELLLTPEVHLAP
jgi:hypothetical protein